MRRYFLLVLTALVQILHGDEEAGYYWLDYNGTIPENALIGGYDCYGENIYIGLGETNRETYPATIYPNKSEIEVPIEMVSGIKQTLNSSIKILCGKQSLVKWIRANSKNLQVVLIGENPVTGGHIEGKGDTHIGRISYEDEIGIGPILSYRLNAAKLWVVHHSGLMFDSESYEVLLYQSSRKKRRRGGRRPNKRVQAVLY